MKTKSMFARFLSVLVGVCVVLGLALAPAAQAGTITVGDPLIPPGLVVGNTFHFAFHTSTSADGTQTDIAYYNNFVQTVANSAGSKFEGKGWTWKCIGSTATINARDNALVSAPVYLWDGLQVATGYADMWDGSIINGIRTSEKLNNRGPYVMTGTLNNGTGATGAQLGSGNARAGDAWVNNSQWINVGWSEGNTIPVYALSEPLTIVSATPPSTPGTLIYGK